MDHPMQPGDGMPSPPMSMMEMTFYWGQRVTLLSSKWTTGSSVVLYLLTLAAVFTMAFFHQLLGRLHLRPPASAVSGSASTKLGISEAQGVGARSLGFQVAVYAAYVSLGYLLMLMVMSYNLGVFLAVVVGATAGFLAFHRHHGGSPQQQQQEICA